MRCSLWTRFLSVLVVLPGVFGGRSIARGETIDFEDLGLAANSFWNGADNSGGFTSRGARFNNQFVDWGSYTSWGGWAYSTKTDVTDPTYNNQYSAITGAGYNNSPTYGVGYMDSYTPVYPKVELPAATRPVSVMLANTTYAALVMKNGDKFAHKFGPTDWFKVIITGLSAGNQEIGTLEVSLAQGTDILTEWKTVDLSSLTGARSLSFAVDSSDTDPAGGWLNTPAYFAMDNLAVAAVPEPSMGVLLVGGLGLLVLARRRHAWGWLLTAES